MSDWVLKLQRLAKYANAAMSSEELTRIADEITALRARLEAVTRTLGEWQQTAHAQIDRAERAEAALATAFEVAAYTTVRVGDHQRISALTPADAQAALDQMLRDAKAEGMREAANLLSEAILALIRRQADDQA